MNCTTMDKPCATIQYVVDKMAILNDIIKIDGSLGIFTVTSEVQISNCMNLTFTSYNGVAWIHGDVKLLRITYFGYFLTLDYPKGTEHCELHFNTLNFRNTKLANSFYFLKPDPIVTMTLTVTNCLFDFSGSEISEYGARPLIVIESKHSYISIENCIMTASCKIGILEYSSSRTCTKFPSTQITLKNTYIEDAWYVVQEFQDTCTYATIEESSKLTVINSLIHSRGNCKVTFPQFWFLGGAQEYIGDFLVIYMENSRFENILVGGFQAAVMHIQWLSRVFIRNCTFKGNIGVVGGAIYLQSTHLTIVDSRFYDNEARKFTLCSLKDQAGIGGAIFVNSNFRLTAVKIYNSSFINNKATCVGSSIYMGAAHEIVGKQTQFITSFTSSPDTIWFSSSQTLLLDQVSFEARQDSMQGGELFLSETNKSFPSERVPIFKCPIGSMLHFLDSNHVGFRTRRVTCQYCQYGTYTSTPSNMSGFSEINSKQRILQPQCQLCSFGATCKHGIKPKPNFWGYVHKSKAFLIACPPGYCCQTSNQCIALNSCNSKRTGRLCGKCKDGYFQSVFTTNCLEDKICKPGKYWTLAIITCIMFTVLFMFLQDIFFFIAKVLNMNYLASVLKKKVGWLGETLQCVRSDGYQFDQRSENESNGYREGQEVERDEEPENYEGIATPNENSTAGGLIKIVFSFYQIHSIITVYKSSKGFQYIKDLRELASSIFNLNSQVPLSQEFHCPLHGIGSITKVWIKALFPVNCLLFAGFLYAFSVALSHFSSNQFIWKCSTKAKPRLLAAMLQLTLLGYSTLISSILSFITCISLENGDRILYIDGNVPCYQQWQYAIIALIVIWAIPLIYILYKLPRYIRKEQISVRGVYIALLLPLPFAIYKIVRSERKLRRVISDDLSNNQCKTVLIPYIRMKRTNVTMLQLLDVIEGPFRYKTSGEKGERLSWEPVLLLQRILLSLCRTFALQPGMRSLLLLLFVIIFLYMNAHCRPFSSGFLNAINGITFILICITASINAIYAFIFEYGSITRGPFAQLLDIFDYFEFVIIMIFPVIAVITLTTLVIAKFTGFVAFMVGFLIAKCKRWESRDD